MNDISVQALPETLTKALKNHLPLHVINDFLKKKSLATVKTWEDLSLIHKDQTSLMTQILEEVICFGRKSIFAFRTPDGWAKSTKMPTSSKKQDIFQSIKSPSKFHQAFSCFSHDSYDAYTYFIEREAIETCLLGSSDLSDSARSKYWSPESVFKVQKPIKYCAFDSILIDKEKDLIYVLLDNLRYRTKQDSSDIYGDLLAAIDNHGDYRKSLSPIDLYSAIGQMYSYSDEGIVCQLSFECGTGAVRDEKLKQGELDLRKELYHVNGKAAVGKLHPYKIELSYHQQKYSSLHTEANFSIKGRRANIAKKGGLFKSEILSNSPLADLTFCLNRLALYIQNEQAN